MPQCDQSIPKQPSCGNKFILVKVQTFVNDQKAREFVRVSARFGMTMESKEQSANRSGLALANPYDSYTSQIKKLIRDAALVHRGDCTFTTKARVAQAVGAVALLVVNEREELYKMVCANNESTLEIKFIAVMLPKTAGDNLEQNLKAGKALQVLIYSLDRPLVDIAEAFLWLMTVGTILCASFWSSWSARDVANEHYKTLKDDPDAFLEENEGDKGVVDIKTTSAILFVVIASCFLILLYKFISEWFLELLVVLFYIGGVEGLQTCLVAFLSRCLWLENELFPMEHGVMHKLRISSIYA